MKIQHPNRWILNSNPWSKNQLEGKLLRDPNPVEIYSRNINCPFNK